MAGVWSKIGSWLGGGGAPAKGKAKTAKGRGARRPGATRTEATKAYSSDGRTERQRLIEEAMRIRAEKMEGFKDMDPETRARIEKAALGKLNPKKPDAPEDD